MSLLAALTPLPVASTGDMEFTVATISSLIGLQEIEQGWVLANGFILPVGAKYDPLRTLMGSSYGAVGQLPTIIDGVQPVARGASKYTTLGAVDGAVNVTLALAHITPHAHTYLNQTISVLVNSPNGWMSYPESAGDGGNDLYQYFTDSQGGGGSHNNMPPYFVVEGMLVKL